MTSTLGLAIASNRVGAVLARSGTVMWSGARDYADATNRTECIADLVASVPRRRWTRKRVIAAIGPHGVQVKRLTGLPTGLDLKASRAIVRESIGRFFLKNGIPLEISCASTSDGEMWAAAYDATLVGEIEHACRVAGWRVTAVVPGAVALRFVLPDGSITLDDGDLRLDVMYANSELSQVRCSRRGADPPVPARPQLPSALAASSHSASELVTAYAATHVSAREPLLVSRARPFAKAPSARQLVTAVSACALAFACWRVTPGVVDTVRATGARHALAVIAVRLNADRHVSDMLDSVTNSLRATLTFDDRVRSISLMLAEITRALPDSAAILELQMNDSTGGSLVGVAPRAADLLGALERVPVIAAPTIAGPVASTSLGGRSLERVSIAFRFAEP